MPVTFDTIKVGCSTTALCGYNEDFFFDQTCSFKGAVFKKHKVLNKPFLGIDSIKINPLEEKIELRASSKALKELYPQMLNKDTLPTLVNNLFKQEIIELDYNEFLNTAEVYEAHVTRDLKLTEDSPQYFRDLSFYLNHYNYRSIDYSPYGLEVSGTAKSNSKRMIFYDKFSELTRQIKINEILSKYIPAGTFKGVFRIEGEMSDFATLRKFFGLGKKEPPLLKKIIESELNPCLSYFEYLFPPIKIDKTLLTATASDKTFNEIEKEIAMRNIIEHFNYDLPTILKFIESKVKGNISEYRKRYKEMLIKMKAEKLGSDFKTIEEIRDKLRIC